MNVVAHLIQTCLVKFSTQMNFYWPMHGRLYLQFDLNLCQFQCNLFNFLATSASVYEMRNRHNLTLFFKENDVQKMVCLNITKRKKNNIFTIPKIPLVVSSLIRFRLGAISTFFKLICFHLFAFLKEIF